MTEAQNSVASASGNVVHSPIADQKKRKENKKQQLIMDQKMNAFEFRRQAVSSKLQRIREVLGKPEEITVHHLDTYLRRVDACYDEYNNIQNEVYACFPDQREEQEEYFIAFEQLYEELRVKICCVMETFRSRQVAVPAVVTAATAREQQVIANQPPGLPTVPLPTFDGTYERWFRFKQLFQDLMQKHPGLSDATKLHYLAQSLKGKAENVLSEQILNENNFQGAWNILEERFENKRTVIDIHVGGLLNLKKMNKECSSDLRQLVEECSRHVEALEFHDQPMEGMSEQLVVSLLTSKLDKTTLNLWESTVTPKELPDYKETMQFLQNRCFVLERCEAGMAHRTCDGMKPKQLVVPQRQHVKVHAALQINENVCPVCEESHHINKCNTLKQMTVPERIAIVKDKQLCFNCLKRGHRVGQCKSRMCTIVGCGKKHHTQLHNEAPVMVEKKVNSQTGFAEGNVSDQSKEQSLQSERTTSTITCSSAVAKSRYGHEVILTTAVVQVRDFRGGYRSCRALLDSGSQSNFLSENCVKMLRLKLDNVCVPIVGINGEKITAKQQTTTEVKSSVGEASWTMDFLIVPQVTGIIPLQKIDVREWKIPSELNLADPRFNIPAKVDMLIGAELFYELLITERLKLNNDNLMLWRSELGWIVCGSYKSFNKPLLVKAAPCKMTDTNLEHSVQRFWEQEEIPESTISTAENEQCVKHFQSTHRRENGRFLIRLPFRSTVAQLGSSRNLAERRFLQMERRFDSQPELKEQYVSFINEYLSLGHCRKINIEENNDSDYFLPHHAILKPTSSTTKIRVVFDASARSDTNLSLNDVLVAGPVLQDSLMAIVLRFRRYKYVFTADIVKMFRQIKVDEADSVYQKILWRENPQEPLQTLELTTITYGTSCAPFCATACLKQLAQDERAAFPNASQIVEQDFYMDDVLSGADDLQMALEGQDQLIAMLHRGGFHLHKWCANTPVLLERIPEREREMQVKIEEHSPNEVIKALGLLWDPNSDNFLFRIDTSETREYNTKRTVLSDTAKIFDPLGFLGPVTIKAKIFIQELWSHGVCWDERLTADQESRWNRFTQELQRIDDLKIPRRAVADGAVIFEIHGFSDASKKAYGACVYLRSVKSDGTADLHLLSSKTRVAPLPKKAGSKRSNKPFTIPRAELCGAHLLAHLVQLSIAYV
ncbi:uncharacterized protein LOC134221621 [Armigeres subalbatus]|uniref:uncharacterized protein LOC134221621 n=1 Tax=Armigeres subalbatus TaxID=124917 RepID=UPI002ED25D3B